MHKVYYLLLFAAFIPHPASFGQDKPLMNISFEGGYEMFLNQAGDKPYIRSAYGSAEANDGASTINSSYYQAYGGLRYEFRYVNNKVGFLTGLKYIYTFSTIKTPRKYNQPVPDYFFFLYFFR